MTEIDKQERVHRAGVENLQEAYGLLTSIFLEADFSYKDWVDVAHLPAKITWAQLQEISKRLSDGLCEVEFPDEPFYMRSWAYLDGMSSKQLLEMSNDNKSDEDGSKTS